MLKRKIVQVLGSFCCRMNPTIICHGCDKYWCEKCNPSNNPEWNDPKGHKCLGKNWMCPAGGFVWLHKTRGDGISHLERYVE